MDNFGKKSKTSVTVDTIYNLSSDGNELRYKKNKLKSKVEENKCNFNEIQVDISGVVLEGNIEYKKEDRIVPFRLTGELKSGSEYGVKDVILDCKDEYNNFEVVYVAVTPNSKNLFNDKKKNGKDTFLMYILEKDTRNYICLEDVNTQLIDTKSIFENSQNIPMVDKELLLWRTKYMKSVDQDQCGIMCESEEDVFADNMKSAISDDRRYAGEYGKVYKVEYTYMGEKFYEYMIIDLKIGCPYNIGASDFANVRITVKDTFLTMVANDTNGLNRESNITNFSVGFNKDTEFNMSLSEYSDKEILSYKFSGSYIKTGSINYKDIILGIYENVVPNGGVYTSFLKSEPISKKVVDTSQYSSVQQGDDTKVKDLKVIFDKSKRLETKGNFLEIDLGIADFGATEKYGYLGVTYKYRVYNNIQGQYVDENRYLSLYHAG